MSTKLIKDDSQPGVTIYREKAILRPSLEFNIDKISSESLAHSREYLTSESPSLEAKQGFYKMIWGKDIFNLLSGMKSG